MHKEILLLSWLGGQMTFLVARNGEIVASWESDAEINDLETDGFDLSSIIVSAVEKTGYRGKNVGMVIQHPLLTQQLISTPPAKGRDLEIYLERQVDQLKVTEESVAIAWLETQPIKTSKGLVLCLFPKLLQEKLIESCRLAKLHLIVLVPPTALLVDAVAELDMGEEQIAAFAARVGISTTIVVGRQSGNVFLARSLRCNWDDSPERFESELNRSAIFMRQQFGLDIDCVWLAGPGSEAQSLRMLPEAALPIRVCPTELSAQYLGAQLLKLDPECSANLIDREQRDAPKRRLFVRISGGVIGLLLALSLLIAVFIEYQLHSETRTLAILQPKAAKLEEQKATLEKKFKNLNEHKEITTLLLENRLPPVPGWLLSHITEVLPEELVITKVEVNRVDMLTQVGASAVPPEGIWRARVEGQGIPSKKVAPADVKAAYKHFSEALESGPFHMQITSATKHYAPRSIEGWIYTDGAPVDKSYQFFIEGVMEGSTVR